MKRFIIRLAFFCLFFLSFIIVGIVLPPTPRSRTSLLFAKPYKDSLLKNVPSPRIVFVGGSNLSFGLDCALIKDSLQRNPIDNGIHASLGLIYMLSDVSGRLKSGDMVVVVPEYANYYGRFAYGGEELLRTIMDVRSSKINSLNEDQWVNIYKYIPKYAISKLFPSEYYNIKTNKLYGVKSFNEYGDVEAHWNLPKEDFEAVKSLEGEFNYKVIEELQRFQKEMEKINVSLYVSYPCFQATSFKNCRSEINKIDHELKKSGLKILGTPERYMVADSLMFNRPYHLSGIGVKRRTQLLIEDIKVADN